jgi:hypothetical protein
MADRTCTVPDCGRVEQLRLGYCNRHYKACRVHGDPLGQAPAAWRICSVPECGREEQLRQGMCEMHYRRWRRNGVAGQPGSLRIIGDDLARFWSHVTLDGPLPERVEWLGPCWLWTGAINDKGYGLTRVTRRTLRAHQWSFAMFVGPVPDGLELDHLCRNTACVRPSHLEPVTTSENVRRRNLALAGKPWLTAA